MLWPFTYMLRQVLFAMFIVICCYEIIHDAWRSFAVDNIHIIHDLIFDFFTIF